MKNTHLWLAILLLAAGSPLSSDAQMLKNLVNNMKNNLAAKPKPSISPADSAAAIKSFMTGAGGGGFLYQYRVTYRFSIRKKDSVSTDTTSSAITDAHDARTDMGEFGSRMAVLGHAGMPRYSVTLHPDLKTYTFNIIDTALINSADGNTYQVARVGNETIQGYSCIHSRLTIVFSGKSQVTEDIWTSKDVAGYALLQHLSALQNVTPKMIQALEQAGCGGMFVKMAMQSSAFSMQMVLISAGRKTFPDSMFQIPAGYTQQTTVNPFAHGIR